jgi:peptidoglycan/LPS O-acetylase OafA/YrhL
VKNSLSYRPYIDGLRAIAVLSVIGFHYWPNFVKSGFVGVDIFFVISGFVITKGLLSNNKVTIEEVKKFYDRRVRRIFPALIILLALNLLLGYWLLFADEFRNLSKYLLSGGMFTANFVAYYDINYFSQDSINKPLLHLWSLGIEEQFYLIFPLIIAIQVYFFRRRNSLPIVEITIIGSFGFWIHLQENSPSLAYYLSLSRFWELLIGVSLAFRKELRLKSFKSSKSNW